MKAHLITLIALLGLVPAIQASQQPQSPQQGSPASIRGTVVNAATNQPVTGAIVELTGIEQGRVVSHAAISGSDGTFEMLNLSPRNDYELVASDPGNFMPAAYGQHNLNEPWSPLSLTSGQSLSGIQLMLTPLTSITGKVIDENGKPLSRAEIYILRAAYSGGHRELQRVATTQTNDHGEYFWSGTGGGQYYVRANPANGTDQQLFQSPAAWDSNRAHKEGEPEGYPTAYYPNVMFPASAKAVDLMNGGKAQGIDITAQKMRTHRISGTVLANAGSSSTPQPAAGAHVLLVPREAGQESSYTRSVPAGSNGQFDIRGVLPGAYYLVAIVADDKNLLIARKSIDIATGGRDNARSGAHDSDLQKLSITVSRGFDIAGSVRFADWQNGAPPDYSQLAINLIPDLEAPVDRSSAGNLYMQAPLTLSPLPNGEFTLRNIAPGDYRIILSLNPKRDPEVKIPLDMSTAYMKSATLGSTEVLEGGIHIDGKPEGRLQITLATNSGSVFGRVLDENHEPAAPVRMVIVPDAAHRKRLDLYNTVVVSSSGRFLFDGIPPGDYKLFAWTHVEDGAWLDPEFLRVYEDRGIPVHIEESGSHPVEVPLIH